MSSTRFGVRWVCLTFARISRTPVSTVKRKRVTNKKNGQPQRHERKKGQQPRCNGHGCYRVKHGGDPIEASTEEVRQLRHRQSWTTDRQRLRLSELDFGSFFTTNNDPTIVQFSKMTFQQELSSWNPFSSPSNIQEIPIVGDQAPSTGKLQITRGDKSPVVIAFLRHCGCPFAEKIFLAVRKAAEETPQIHFIAVSHSDSTATDKWLKDVGGSGKVEVIVDNKLEIFTKYGLGHSSFWAVLNPWSLSNAIQIGKKEGFQIRPTESGSRWQTAGLFSIDANGMVKYAHKANTSDDLGDLDAAIAAVRDA